VSWHLYPDVVALEMDLLRRLQADPVLRGWQVAVSEIPGLNREDIKTASLFGRLPALGTYFGRSDFDDPKEVLRDEVVRFAILCAGSSLRRPAQARVGDETNPGALHLSERARMVLESWPVQGTNLKYIKPRRRVLGWCNSQVAVWVLEGEARLTRPVIPTPEEVHAYGSSYPEE
jgi:hypothetical protein